MVLQVLLSEGERFRISDSTSDHLAFASPSFVPHAPQIRAGADSSVLEAAAMDGASDTNRRGTARFAVERAYCERTGNRFVALAAMITDGVEWLTTHRLFEFHRHEVAIQH